MGEYTGKIALVTGAAINIGKATSLILARGDAKVIAVDLNEAGLDSLKTELRAFGADADTYVCDVSDEARVREVCTDALKKNGHVDILVNNAGIYNCDIMPFADSEPEMWKKKIDINIYGTLYFIHALLPSMIENRSGRIINLASVAGMYGKATMADYALTKGGIIAFSKSLAREVAQYGILVNSVSPGNIDPDPRHAPGLSYLDRSGSPEECAELICFLAGNKGSFLSGENYVVDGCRKLI